MTAQIPDLQPIVTRIATLERQNRIFKLTLLICFIVMASVGLMGQTAPPPQVIEAQRFVLKDSHGKIRGWIGTIGVGSEFILGDDQAEPVIRLLTSRDAANLHLYGSRMSGMTLSIDSGVPNLAAVGADSSGDFRVAFTSAGPALTLTDRKGFSASVGAALLKPTSGGEAQQISAASLALMDNEKNVIWRAPR